MSKKIIGIIILFFGFFLIQNKNLKANFEKDWYQKVQIYCMVALPPEDVEKFHITVNGLWNGYIGEISSPFAFGRLMESIFSGNTYNSDKEFVETMHDQGLLVPATILTAQGHRKMQGAEFEKLACRSSKGKLPNFDLEADSYFMCANNPNWINWMIKHGKKAIDAGADLIVLDEIQGNSFFPMFQFIAHYIGTEEPGFCSYCIEGFRKHLRNRYSPQELKDKFNINDIDKENLLQRIASTNSLPYKERVETDPLVKEYIYFQELNNYLGKKKLIEALKNYAKQKGKEIPISANSYTLGTNRWAGYWAKGLIFSDLVDFYTFENAYTIFEDVPNLSFPRNKWLAWEKLARAATNAPAVILPDTEAIKEIVNNSTQKNKSYKNYLYILMAEAYANQGAFVNYYIKGWGTPENWLNCAKLAEFIIKNQDLYNTPSKTYASIGLLLLYTENLKDRIFSYLGFAQALAESNIPFDVIFGGGGPYLKNRINLKKLNDYELLIIPEAKNISSRQKNTIQQYVKEGGKALIFDPETFGLTGTGEVTYGKGSFIISPTWTYGNMEWNIGSLYFFNYENSLREQISSLVKLFVPVTPIMENTDRKVITYPYYQPEKRRIVVHMVNYDHNLENDEIATKKDLVIRIKIPDYPMAKSAFIISPDFEEKIFLKPEIKNNFWEFKIPSLNVYNVIVIGGKGIKQ
ncbi:hypothetical protein NLC93_07175, partial [Candidatus Aminicenantes bacterium AC-335-G13]|nr:hypothetical protein [Candidatus Aminicenantes bacterium AC-335-G13]